MSDERFEPGWRLIHGSAEDFEEYRRVQSARKFQRKTQRVLDKMAAIDNSTERTSDDDERKASAGAEPTPEFTAPDAVEPAGAEPAGGGTAEGDEAPSTTSVPSEPRKRRRPTKRSLR